MRVACMYRTANRNGPAPARRKALPIRANRAQRTNEVVHGIRFVVRRSAFRLYLLRALLIDDCVDRFCVLKTPSVERARRLLRPSPVSSVPVRALLPPPHGHWTRLGLRWGARAAPLVTIP